MTSNDLSVTNSDNETSIKFLPMMIQLRPAIDARMNLAGIEHVLVQDMQKGKIKGKRMIRSKGILNSDHHYLSCNSYPTIALSLV